MPTRVGNLEAVFGAGAARYADLAYFAVAHKPLLAGGSPHTFFVSRDRGEWMDCGRTTWRCAGLTVVKAPTEAMLGISEDGEVYTYVGGRSSEERISPTPAALSGVTTIDGKAVAFGMRRQVFVRTEAGCWAVMSAPEPGEGEAAGFEAVCGTSFDELYAVGWRGEIWQSTGNGWIARPSPTEVILASATVHEDGKVYACGQSGTVLRGRREEWSALASSVNDDLWSIHSFGSRIFVAALTSLYELIDDTLQVVTEAAAIASTFGTLTAAEGVLWSVGEDDVICFDGTAWSVA